MRRIAALTVLVLALGAGVWTVTTWSSPADVVHRAEPEVPAVPEYKPVTVRATPGQQSLTLTGTVRDPSGRPIADADVFLAAATQQSLTTSRCAVCNEPMLSCRAHETTRAIWSAFETHRADLLAALSTRSDSQGHFRFAELSGTSFMVWGRAAGHGEGMKERAAPGESVELYLPAPRSIVGTLKDESGAPMAGTVRAMSRRLAHVIEVAAGRDGRFVLRDLGEGPFYVVGSAPGRLPGAREQVEAGPEEITISLAGPRRLEVRLVSQGKPIDGLVALQGPHLTRELTAKGGFVAIDSLYPGELMVHGVAGELSSAPSKVTLSSQVTQLTLSLDRGGRLAVSLLDEAGQPVPDPAVDLLTRNLELVAHRRLKTGELGLFGPVGAGDYVLRATSEGFHQTQVPAAVKAGETNIDLTLTRGTLIAGGVIDEYGRPAPGVSVLVTPTGESVVADAEGHFRASVPSPGLYTLQAHHSDWGGGEIKVTAPKLDVDLQLEPKGGAEVTVSLDGRRVEGAQVVLFHSQGNYRSDRPSGADGVVLMRGLPPDTYTLVATHPDFLPSERQSLTLQDGQMVKVSAELKAGAAVKGQVIDTLGAPVAGVLVAVMPRGAEPTKTDGAGNFELSPLRPKGVYAVRVIQRGFEQVERPTATAGGERVRVVVKREPVYRGRVLGDGQPLKSFRVEEYEVNSADGRFELPLPGTADRVIVSVEAPGFEPLVQDRPNTPDLGDFDLKRAARVTGIVREEGGGPVSDAVVTCDRCEQSVLSDAEGRFSLGKPALQHEFKIIASKGRRTATRTVTDKAIDGVELVLKPGVRLSGIAWQRDGRPAAGVEIAGVHIDRSETVNVVTGADGSYSTEVPAGTYRFMFAPLTEAQLSSDPPALITDVQGREMRLDFGPAPGLGTITARVSPLPGYALWLLKGEQRAFGNPPMELLRASWAQLVYQPHSDRVSFGGLAPGRYTLVWASFHAQTPDGPIAVSVDVPTATEVRLIR